MKIRILVADDHQLYAEALATTLGRVQGFEVVATADDGQEVLSLALRSLPQVALFGVGSNSGAWLRRAGELRQRLPDCAVVLITGKLTQNQVDRAVAAGVLGVVPRYAKLSYLISAVRGAATGCVTLDPQVLRAPRPGNRALSEREVEILRLTATGASIKEISRELFLASGTVRNLASAAIKKLEGRNRFDAARIAGERGWL